MFVPLNFSFVLKVSLEQNDTYTRLVVTQAVFGNFLLANSKIASKWNPVYLIFHNKIIKQRLWHIFLCVYGVVH